MKSCRNITSWQLLLLLLITPLMTTKVEAATGNVDISTVYQELEGFGASNVWSGYTLVNLGNHDPNIYDIIFGDLGLDILRLRNTYGYTGYDADYIDNCEHTVTNGRARTGRPLKILISSWSPQGSLKSTGNTYSYNGTLAGGPSDYVYEDYAIWWADSLEEYADHNMVADYISMQNEPDFSPSNPEWDSCRFEPTETTSFAGYDQAFDAVYSEIYSRMGPNMPKMLAPETTGFNRAGQYINALDNPSHVYGYAHHLYNCSDGGNAGCASNPDNYIDDMNSFGSTYNDRPILQTEYSDDDHVTTYEACMDLAVLMHNSMVVEGATGYLYWQLAYTDIGLVGITNYNWTINPIYYAFKHYSAYTDPGWHRVKALTDSSDLRISAYMDPNGDELVIVIINTSPSTDIDLSLSLAAFEPNDSIIYQTTSSEYWSEIGDFNEAVPVSLPRESITTIALLTDIPLTPPAPPTGLEATAGNGVISLDWNDNTEYDLDGYNVYRSTTSGSGYSQLNGSLLSDSNYIDNTAATTVNYYYVVTAVDTDGTESGYSNEASAMLIHEDSIRLSYADFESGWGEWVNVTDGNDTHDWLRDSNGTPTTATGPNNGALDSTWYVYFETSEGYAYNPGDTAYLEGPYINDSNNRTLSFYYHMYGSDMGTLNVDVYDGSWNYGVWSISGEQHSTKFDPYTQAIVGLGSYMGPIKIRFRAVAAGYYNGDMAIDDIEVKGVPSEWLYGDFTGDGIVNIYDLPEFCEIWWLENDCNETAGLDLNDDCIINFYEYSFFAQNWLEEIQ